MSEALIPASTNPQYDKRLFIELPVEYMKIPGCFVHKFFKCQNKKQFVDKTCSELGIFMYSTGNSMNNLRHIVG